MDAPSLTDDLVVRAAAGDDDAVEQLLRAVDGPLRSGLRIAAAWRRHLTVDDVLQVSYLEAYLRIGSLRDRTVDGFRAWMRRVVDHNLADAIKGLNRDKRPDPRRRVTQGVEGESARTLFARVAGSDPSVTQAIARAEQVTRLREAIDRLPADYRFVVQEADLAERRVAEIAEEMGRSPGAVHLLRARAHDRLGELLSRVVD